MPIHTAEGHLGGRLPAGKKRQVAERRGASKVPITLDDSVPEGSMYWHGIV